MLTLADICARLSSDPNQDTATHYLTLYSLARFLPALKAVEIGVDDGSTTLPLLLGVAACDGHLWSIDPAPCLDARAAVEDSGLAHRWSFVNRRSAEFSLHAPRDLDLVFIDGDHSYEGVKSDWQLFEPLVRPNGIIAIHDKMNTREFPGIARLIDREIRPEWERLECLTLPYGWGLTLIRKVLI